MSHDDEQKMGSTDSSSKLKLLLLSMSFVGIVFLDAIHARKQAFIGALNFQAAFARKLGQFDP